MRTTLVGVLTLIILTTFCNHAQTADAPTQYPGAHPVELKVGEVITISKSFDIVTPVITPICDDLKVVDVVDTPDGPAFKGIAPGKTLCSVRAGAGGLRRVFSITVNKE